MKTIGLLGGGQLGRMIAQEGKKLGFSFLPWDPVAGGPAEQVCGQAVVAPFDDAMALDRFADACDLITLEWENVPAQVVVSLHNRKPVKPGASVLRIIQDRLMQREFLKKHGFPQTEYKQVDIPEDVTFPGILKTRRHGYDGKGQKSVEGPQDALDATNRILERRVSFIKEISVILARTQDGRTAVYPVAENVHRNGILHTTLAPARVPASVAEDASRLALAIAEKLGHVGVMAVELFWLGGTGEGQLLVNEIAPRVHNSGHYTWGACETSQFEQHVRAVAGMPLGSTALRTPAVMLNLLGDLWAGGEPDWTQARSKGTLVLYGKGKAAPGRKMGHVVLTGDAEKNLVEAERLLTALRR